mmetsp:Transcript_4320/g.16913  ORF Transcript_4320/g.16913 Transcript_4320/m.16913 type:complete len:330 (-) Transcript_4320:152-1141(-)
MTGSILACRRREKKKRGCPTSYLPRTSCTATTRRRGMRSSKRFKGLRGQRLTYWSATRGDTRSAKSTSSAAWRSPSPLSNCLWLAKMVATLCQAVKLSTRRKRAGSLSFTCAGPRERALEWIIVERRAEGTGRPKHPWRRSRSCSCPSIAGSHDLHQCRPPPRVSPNRTARFRFQTSRSSRGERRPRRDIPHGDKTLRKYHPIPERTPEGAPARVDQRHHERGRAPRCTGIRAWRESQLREQQHCPPLPCESQRIQKRRPRSGACRRSLPLHRQQELHLDPRTSCWSLRSCAFDCAWTEIFPVRGCVSTTASRPWRYDPSTRASSGQNL